MPPSDWKLPSVKEKKTHSSSRYALNLPKAWGINGGGPTDRVIPWCAWEKTFSCQCDLLIHHDVLRGHCQVSESGTLVKTLWLEYGKIHSLMVLAWLTRSVCWCRQFKACVCFLPNKADEHAFFYLFFFFYPTATPQVHQISPPQTSWINLD